MGVEGVQPPPRGLGGCAPTIPKRGRVACISNPATSGAQNPGKPSAYEGGQNGGSRGAKPHGGGLWGVCPSDLTPCPPSLRALRKW